MRIYMLIYHPTFISNEKTAKIEFQPPKGKSFLSFKKKKNHDPPTCDMILAIQYYTSIVEKLVEVIHVCYDKMFWYWFFWTCKL